jgi:hypothetical protein
MVVALLATQGILMTATPFTLVIEVFGVIEVYIILLGFIKVPVFSKLNLN